MTNVGNSPAFCAEQPVRVGLIGTGYAAKLRAEALMNSDRAQLVAVVGHTPEKTEAFSQTYQAQAMSSWQQLVSADLDLVIIANINQAHGEITRAALENDQHVVVEYPLSLDLEDAEALITLAQTQGKLLHVEHIEMLGGLHQALKQNLPSVGDVFYARYSTIKPQRPAPRKWTYHHEMFGFPLMGALSRVQRLTDLFGEVATVNCHQRYAGIEPDFYQSCLVTTQLCFANGLLAQIIYGKGETLWQAERKFEVHGEHGGLVFEGDRGVLLKGEETIAIEVGSRRGLFAQDTAMVLDYLIHGTPLYITPQASLYALKVADAARRAAELGITVIVED